MKKLWTSGALVAISTVIGCGPAEDVGTPAYSDVFEASFAQMLADPEGLLARVPLGSQHAFEIYDAGEAIGSSEVGVYGVTPSERLAKTLPPRSPSASRATPDEVGGESNSGK